MKKCRFFSITNPPPCNMENYGGIPSLTDPSQDEPIALIVKKLLAGAIRVPPSDIEYDTEDITQVKDVDRFMTEHETLRPGMSDLSDTQVYAELAKKTIARLKRVSSEQKASEPVPPSAEKKVETGKSQERSNEDLNATGK